MAQDKIGQAGIRLPGQLPQGVRIFEHVFPAVPFRKPAVFLPPLGRAAVSQVIMTDHRKAVIGQIAGKGGITADIFRNTVNQLDDSTGRALIRQPPDGAHRMGPIAGGKRKFPHGCHSQTAPFMIK